VQFIKVLHRLPKGIRKKRWLRKNTCATGVAECTAPPNELQ